MKDLDKIIAEATAAIDEEYFLLPIAEGPSVYRERVYCYELYHQMRSRWPARDVCRYLLNGEVDKSGHAKLATLGFRGEKPDLLVHGPGSMSDNYAVIEVKAAANVDVSGFRTDLSKLALFHTSGEYRRAIYLIYGYAADEHVVQRIGVEAVSIEGCAGIEIWLHPGVHASAQRVRVLGRRAGPAIRRHSSRDQ